MQITARATIITTCTNRKRYAPAATLRAGELRPGTTAEVALAWQERLAQAPKPWAAGTLYLGRSFSDATSAAKIADANLLIVSAGLGLVSAQTMAPSYDLTVAPTAAGSVLRKTSGDARAWWAQIQQALDPAPAFEGDALILAALSRPYLDMVADAWVNWPQERLSRLRLFSKEAPSGLGEAFSSAWMPYDDRLDRFEDGRYAGTQGDFAQRALKHFVETIGVTPRDASTHRDAVLLSLEGLAAAERPNRQRHDDEKLKAMIHRDWVLVGGRSGAMLRHLRDTLGVACEQGRFKILFHQVASERGGSLV
ncbi:hypothetical protein OVA11_06160 [Caulobacter sp. SL161]|uniref:hypothetical protein n=1 Tax=Caulobacter sp. SL161 TaxID=2995156 RepID=UPI00227362DA|nr:hypothetical protein [Caulobacter sp. SL161]MCY1646673.1 hypothetical protein [Caulobacter sp. SL161]